MKEYSQGICQDGAAILEDGRMMTIEDILEKLKYHERLVEALRDMVEIHERQDTQLATPPYVQSILQELEGEL